MDELKLEDGKTYKARNGDLVKVESCEDQDAVYQFEGPSFLYTSEGSIFINETSAHDLVELVQPNPEAIAGALLAERVGVLGTTACSPDRAGDYAQIVLRGMMESMDTTKIREYIDLYDSAVDGTSGKLDLQ